MSDEVGVANTTLSDSHTVSQGPLIFLLLAPTCVHLSICYSLLSFFAACMYSCLNSRATASGCRNLSKLAIGRNTAYRAHIANNLTAASLSAIFDDEYSVIQNTDLGPREVKMFAEQPVYLAEDIGAQPRSPWFSLLISTLGEFLQLALA